MHWQLIAQSNFWLLDNLWPILQMIIGIGLIIFVHELGHFLAAKACGVKCEKFYIGFDAFDLNLGVFTIPRRLFYFNWGETEYGIGILPLGGYVRMLGQHDNPAEAEAERERAQKDGQLDPRSYMAKSVPQRMLIISAGVIMNIIFGVIFATIAFYNGVQYEPTRIGSVTAGSPAWENNLSNVNITKVNEASTVDQYFDFRQLMEAVIIGGKDQKVKLEFTRPGKDSQTETLEIKPVMGLALKKVLDLPRLGVSPSWSLKLGSNKDTLVPGGTAVKSGLQPKDRVTHFNGKELSSGTDLVLNVINHWDEEIRLKVLRNEDPNKEGSGEVKEITIAPNPLRRIGVVMKYGGIKAIQKNSPADQATDTGEKLQIGDKIVSLNGNSVDPMLLSHDLRKIAKESGVAKLVVERHVADSKEGEAQKVTINIQPTLTQNWVTTSPNTPYAVNELGIAFNVLNVVDRVIPGSPADKAGFQSGDVISSLLESISDEEKKKFEGYKLSPLEIKEDQVEFAWPLIFGSFGRRGTVDTTFGFTVKRGDKKEKISVKPEVVENYFIDSRGFSLLHYKQIYKSPTLSDAFTTGSWQTWHDCGKIFRFLSSLVTGKVPVTAIGGLPSIAIGATSEAKQGLPRLLLFLTLLSANLAVINFLPIPILDGGHMVFLAWEGITGRPPNEKIQEGLSIVGALLILCLLVFSFGLDFFRIFTLFGS